MLKQRDLRNALSIDVSLILNILYCYFLVFTVFKSLSLSLKLKIKYFYLFITYSNKRAILVWFLTLSRCNRNIVSITKILGYETTAKYK